MTAAPGAGRLVAYTSQSCEQGGGEPQQQEFGPPACAWSIWVADEDGSSPRRVTLGYAGDIGGGGDTNPVWSPDGTRILYERQVTGRGQYGTPHRLWTVRPDGSDPQPITNGGDYDTDSGAAYSPDGSRIAFTSSRSGDLYNPAWSVYTVNADGTHLQQVSDGYGIATFHLWSADGRRVIYSATAGAADGWTYVTYSAAPDGSDRQVAQAGDAIDTPISWSPDGRFAAWHTASFTTAVADLRTGGTTTLAGPGLFPDAFRPGDAATLLVTAYPAPTTAPTINHYAVDLARPGFPHRRLPAGTPNGPMQPDGPETYRSPPPTVFTYSDPYPKFPGGPAPPDPWGSEPRSVPRAANDERASSLPYTAVAFAGLRSVWFSVAHRVGHGHCSYFTGRRFLIHGRCGRTHWRRIPSAAWWEAGTKHLPHGTYEVRFRAIDSHGKRSKSKRRIVRL